MTQEIKRVETGSLCPRPREMVKGVAYLIMLAGALFMFPGSSYGMGTGIAMVLFSFSILLVREWVVDEFDAVTGRQKVLDTKLDKLLKAAGIQDN